MLLSDMAAALSGEERTKSRARRPSEKTEFIRLARTDANAAIWEKLEIERWSVVVRSCYCSIFDDCWVADNRQRRPQQVDECPADWKTFDERPFAGTSGASQAGF